MDRASLHVHTHTLSSHVHSHTTPSSPTHTLTQHPPPTHTLTQHPPPTHTLAQVILLQTHWRRWLAERYVAAFRREKQEREEWERREAVRRQKEREAHVKQEFERRMNPHTKEDFELLYHALESECVGVFLWAVGGMKQSIVLHLHPPPVASFPAFQLRLWEWGYITSTYPHTHTFCENNALGCSPAIYIGRASHLEATYTYKGYILTNMRYIRLQPVTKTTNHNIYHYLLQT